MIRLWISGLFKRRLHRLAGTALGIAVTVGLLGSLLTFLDSSSQSMTSRAIRDVPIDWQVELVPSTNEQVLRGALNGSGVVGAISEVTYAEVSGLEAATGGTIQVTGPGKVISFAAGYKEIFPKEIRPLVGATTGALLAQQTAANLHAGPGDVITIRRPELPPINVTISGVVDLPDADTLFQGVGLPPQASPKAPPDNVLILPPSEWHRIFDPQTTVRPDTTRLQFHVRLKHDLLSSSPTKAYLEVSRLAKNLEARVAGQALVANNIGTRLDAVRGDAVYAAVLFLFLGIPGVALAAILTLAVASATSTQRSAELALLRVRGVSTAKIMGIVTAEAVLTGMLGIALGGLLTVGLTGLPSAISGGGTDSVLVWFSISLDGVLLSALGVVVPTWQMMTARTVLFARRQIKPCASPLWRRYGLDFVLLAMSGLTFWQLASSGYQIVLAPEGVPATAVDYKAFLAPALFWIGLTLLTVRVSSHVIQANGRLLRIFIAPFAGGLTDLAGASLANQSRRITAGLAMTALAVSFAISTAIFNTTYNAQALVDAQLTNGADVTVFGSQAHPASPYISEIAGLPGVVSVVPMQHRFAYVGSDLQDIYGIDPATVSNATGLADAYFRGGNANQILESLKSTPNGVLVSEETVSDFQLQMGDTINLRLLNSADHQYHAVPFKFVGVAREFPTAPKDSFLVANAAYITKMTGSPAAEYALIRASKSPQLVAKKVRQALSEVFGLQVKDIGSASHIIGSSLTSVDLSALTRIELSFSILLAISAAGLMLGLGFADRNRDMVILKVLGANQRQIAGLLSAEGSLVTLGGLLFGVGSGVSISWMLVKLLTGVFDPPPEALTVPWNYLLATLAIVVTSICAAVLVSVARSRRNTVYGLRDL